MAKITISEAHLLEAFESGDGSMQWYLDRQSGDVIPLGDDILSDFNEDEEDDEADAGNGGGRGDDAVEPGDWQAQEKALRRAIYGDTESERYLEIPSLGSHEGFRIMEDFARSQEGAVREALFTALDRRRPFRSFKDALCDFPGVRERWFEFHAERLREEAAAWLQSEGIDAELTRPEPPPA